MTDSIATAAAGVWRRLWSFIQACEMSTAEHRDLRIDALERRVDALCDERQERARVPSFADAQRPHDRSI